MGYEFVTYGETVIIATQCLVLVLLLWYYANPGVFIMFSFIIFCALQWYAGLIFLPIEQLNYLLFFGFIMGNGSRLFQVLTNYKNGHTGLLSLPTVFLNVAGAMARVFTTLHACGKVASHANRFFLGFLLSATPGTFCTLHIAARDRTQQNTRSTFFISKNEFFYLSSCDDQTVGSVTCAVYSHKERRRDMTYGK